MKTVKGFTLRPLCDEFVLVGDSLSRVNFNKLVSMNSSAAYLWREVDDKEFTVDDLKDLLLAKYDVAEEVASKDAAAIAQSWKDAGVVEE